MNSEQALLQRARKLDMQALTEIYDLFSPALYRYAMRLLSDEALAEECVTETFSRFLSALKSDGGPRDYLGPYLYRVAHNLITDHYRNGATAAISLDELNDDDHLFLSDHHEPGLLQHVMDKIAGDHVRAMLVALTPDQRQVIVLKFYEEMTNEEVAAAIGKPMGAIKSLQHRALASLRRLLVEAANAA
jgi:RNA polymerase sigma-70 factor (ECF subfamily)